MPSVQGGARRLGLAATAGLLHALAFPPLGVWPLVFVATAPLVAAVRGAGAARAALLGWVMGTIGSTIVGSPGLAAGVHAYFGAGPVAGWAAATALSQAFHALPVAAFAAAAARLGRLRTLSARVAATAAAWSALEFLRAHALAGGGSPWDLLPHPLYAHPLWTQLADLGGVPLVSFVLAACGAAIAELPVAPARALATLVLVLGVTAGYGAWRLAGELDDGPALRTALVQGNVPDDWRADPAQADASFAALAAATRGVVSARPALVVWPENAISVLLAPNERFARAIRDVVGPDGPPLLLGGPRWAQTRMGRADFYNAAWLLAPSGDVVAVYDKRRLVPFAEQAPLARWARPGDYSPGTEATVFPAPAPFGVLICFEGLYADLARTLAAGGARFLVNISNDAWFAGSGALEQTFAMTAFRAVETRRAIVRVTNTGVTGVIGPSGRVLARFPPGVRGAWTADVPLRDALPLAVRLGDAVAWVAVAATGMALLLAPGG